MPYFRAASIFLLVCSALLAQPAGSGNMLRNGDFEQVSVGHPEGWTLTQHGNECTLGVGPGVEGGHAAKLSCTKFSRGWVIVAQDGVVQVTKGQWYRLTFQCRGEGLRGGVMVALYNRKPWQNCGLMTGLEVNKDWAAREVYFRAKRDAADTRFEFYFSAVGALYLDDVTLAPSGPPPLKGTLPMKPAGNLIVNGSFELGGYLWGTDQRDSLAAVPVDGGRLGHTCLKIAVDPDKCDVYAVDWFEPRFWKVHGNVVATEVWMGVAPQGQLTLSAYLRSGHKPVKATLNIGEIPGRVVGKTFDIGPEWRRCEVTGPCRRSGCFVQIGIQIGEEPEPAELYVDGVQLEPEDHATPFAAREAVELALSTDRHGNIFMSDETPTIELAASCASAAELRVNLKITDCWERLVYDEILALPCRAGQTVRKLVRLTELKKGFFRVAASVPGRSEILPAKLRLAKVEPLQRLFAGQDGPFGINHASPPDSRLELMRTAGITWVRDWTLKWHQVQASEGAAFDFEMGDRQINRVLKHGMKVLCVLPHPATPWCTTAPADLPRTGRSREFRRTLNHMPADLAKFGAYVQACVAHFKDRVKVWEILNEPGYMKPEDYAKLLEVAYDAAKAADPKCKVIGGCGAGPASALAWYRTLFEHDGLKHMDLVNLHPYPGCAPGRASEAGLIAFNECMAATHRRLPIWNTEFLYCSDDDPLPTVMTHNKPAGSCRNELDAANRLVQYNIVFLCYGTEKLFQHTNHWPLRLTRDTLIFSMFFDYGATPKKPFAAHNTMAWLLGLRPRFARLVDAGPDRFCALFQTGQRTLAAMWREAWAPDVALAVPKGMAAYDLMGNPIHGPTFTLTESPVYLVSPGQPDSAAAQLGAVFAATE